MIEERQPTEWPVDEFGPGRHYLLLNCARQCAIPLSQDGPSERDGVRCWGWNGDKERPTVTPSINCSGCGWHKTITNGSAT